MQLLIKRLRLIIKTVQLFYQLLRLKSFEYFKITVKKEHHMLLKAIKQLKLILQS